MPNTTVGRIWVLRLGSALLGVEPKAFKEVLEVSRPTPVPLAPPLLLGLLSHQGQIAPLVDLSQVLQMAPAGSGLAALLEVEGQPLAFPIDEVVGLHTPLGARVLPSPHPLFSAVLEEDRQRIQVLEMGRLLAHLSAQMSPATPAPTPGLTGPQA